MRELKFRAWVARYEKYEPIISITWDTSNRPMLIKFEDTFGDSFVLNSEDVLLEQYTCLKDKNGKEIYEGDIVKCYFYGRMIGLYQVIWNEDNAGLELEAIKGNPKNDNIKDTRALAEMHLFTRVIGNIHENKELLEG